MNTTNRADTQSADRGVGGTYVAALVALGLMAGARAGWGQNQAIDPMNVSGQGVAAPAAAVPTRGVPAAPVSPITPATPGAGRVPVAAPGIPSPAAAAQGGASGAASQAVVPVDVSTQPGRPTAVTPAVPATIPTAAATNPARPVTPAGGPVLAQPVPASPSTPPAAAASIPAVPGATPSAATPVTPASPGTPGTPGTPVPVPVPPLTATTVSAPTPEVVTPGAAIAQDGKSYPITEVKVGYMFPHPSLPSVDDLLNTQIRLGVTTDGYVAPRAGVPVVTMRLGDVGKSGIQKIYHSGIAAIYSHVLRIFNQKGIIGVFVVVDSADIKMDPSNPDKDEDIRPADRTSLQFVVVTSVVKQVRTVAIGETSTSDRVDNPRYEFIRQNSPLQPAPEGGTGKDDLLRKDVLDEYVLRLNRYPGRRVDVALSGTNTPGQLNLDYLVSENRPWYTYLQISNTGTSQTSDIRERFGYVNNELTGHDDILTLDYMTASFTKSHAIIGTYEMPFFQLERVRNKISASWNEYTASDVGIQGEKFSGTGWTAGDEMTMNFFQKRELFLDAIVGLKVQEMNTDNITASTKGYALYTEPYIGVRLERATDLATTTGSLILTDYLTGTSEREREGLGRAAPKADPYVLQYNFAQSFYLEPLIDTNRFVQGKSTLAHELAFGVRGQYAFNQRLFPQAQDVAGGLFSVRGYPESISAGDTVLIGSAEYRFHVPRILAVQDDPTKTPLFGDSFRYSPQTPYGRPDWDLIFKAFVDVGQVNNSQRQSFEKNATLVGTGVGMEFQFKQNLNLRLDWGIALTDLQDQVTAGSNRVHISVTFLY
ncbi:MAG TPA: hypothetical protein VGN88_12955 [Phycisphaerae bacterium]|jgi:hemolysin activation/secretion protein